MVASSARKQYTFHEYTQIPTSRSLIVKRMDESACPVVCRWNNCNKKYNSPEQLARHLDCQHDLSDWVCYWVPCSRNLKPFDARYKLIVHLRCHTGEKPYKCTIPDCTRRFSRIENMRLHVRTHTGEKPYACGHEGCPKRFNNSSDRAKHMKTHLETKPYKCKYPGCDKHYTDPSSMRKHFRSVHFRGDQDKQSKNNLRMHNYSPALPAKQPRIAPRQVIPISTMTPVNNTGLADNQAISINSQIVSTTMIGSNSNNGSNKLVQVPVFQLPTNEHLSGQSDMSQLIHDGKMQPILLQNGDQQSVLMFVPTANMHDAAGTTLTMIPMLPQTHNQQQQPMASQPTSENTLITTGSVTAVHNSNELIAPIKQPTQPAKNIRVIVSSGKSKEQNSYSQINT